jgi:hypothetical protein
MEVNMKTFELNYGSVKTFEAHDASDVVKILRKNHWFPTDNEETFLKQAARTASTWSGKDISFDSPSSFAKDLMKAGILKEISS